jgi:hypothetical protein
MIGEFLRQSTADGRVSQIQAQFTLEPFLRYVMLGREAVHGRCQKEDSY